ncbi:cullin 4 [Strigomonas culicis]|uniref:Cullin 4 n=1 Tax=Strigomonas culicis TaxID=28005 RepID=S9VK75_9TRYP|nr:cullin 4 [Strigomonas culicis]|eukprot:EPY27501.1 cullin 4 [Strigomonas culicis]
MFVHMEDTDQFIHILESLAQKCVRDMINTSNRKVHFIKELLTLADCMSQISSYFPPFCRKVEDTFFKVMSMELNHDKAFIDEVVCFYDRCMHRGTGMSDGQPLCDTMIKLFRLIEDKSVFETTFRNFLAVRLLNESDRKMEEEKKFVEVLRNNNGQEYVYKMERMIADASCATEFQDSFMSAINRHAVQQLPIELHVHIVTQAAWPTYASVPLNLPQSMEMCRNAVTQFYLKRHEERVLKFQLALGSVLFHLFHNKTVYSVSASTVFAPLILSLNSNSCLGVQQLQDTTGLSANDVTEQMTALCRLKLACKTEPGRCQAHPLCYHFNTKFHSTSTEIKVISSTASSIDVESITKHSKSKNQSHHSIDALRGNIMHIMKQKRRIMHTDLCKSVAESMEHFSVPTRAEMKSQIESLIDKGYMYRDEKDSSRYIYTP